MLARLSGAVSVVAHIDRKLLPEVEQPGLLGLFSLFSSFIAPQYHVSIQPLYSDGSYVTPQEYWSPTPEGLRPHLEAAYQMLSDRGALLHTNATNVDSRQFGIRMSVRMREEA